MIRYCRKGLDYAKKYMESLVPGTAAYSFCLLPLMLAEASLNAKENGQAKLKREEVVEIVHQVKMQERIQTK